MGLAANSNVMEIEAEKLLSKKIKRRVRLTPGRLIAIIFLCIVALIYVYPIFWMLDGSFRPMIEIFNLPPRFFQFGAGWPHLNTYSLNNYIKAFNDWSVGTSFFLSVLVTVTNVALTILVTSLCAYAFAFLRFPFKNILFYFILFSFMLPTITQISPYYKLMSTLGLTNTLIGLIVPPAISAMGVFLLRQFYIKLPYSLIESALIDGASHFKIWWNIVLPLSKPALAALSIYQFRGIWNDFLYPMILLRDDKLFTIPVRIKLMDSVNFNKPYDAIMATGFLFSLIPIVIFLIFQRYFIEGLSGGVKG